jgi:hypothetical protein
VTKWSDLSEQDIPAVAARLGLSEQDVRTIVASHRRADQLARRLARLADLMAALNRQSQAIPTQGATRAQQRQLRRIARTVRSHMDEAAALKAEHDTLVALCAAYEQRITSQQEQRP